jgi:hypothetical protein
MASKAGHSTTKTLLRNKERYYTGLQRAKELQWHYLWTSNEIPIKARTTSPTAKLIRGQFNK